MRAVFFFAALLVIVVLLISANNLLIGRFFFDKACFLFWFSVDSLDYLLGFIAWAAAAAYSTALKTVSAYSGRFGRERRADSALKPHDESQAAALIASKKDKLQNLSDFESLRDLRAHTHSSNWALYS